MEVYFSFQFMVLLKVKPWLLLMVLHFLELLKLVKEVAIIITVVKLVDFSLLIFEEHLKTPSFNLKVH